MSPDGCLAKSYEIAYVSILNLQLLIDRCDYDNLLQKNTYLMRRTVSERGTRP